MATTDEALPLAGMLVVDTTRMLPGAVLARALIDQGARLIKIEAPRGGDLLRGAGPMRGGMAVGFAHYFRGAESLPLDLRNADDRRTLSRLLGHADVFVESFRPNTLAAWDLDPAQLRAARPELVTCSLPGYAAATDDPRAVVGHDLNFTGAAGLLSLLPAAGLGPAQEATAGPSIPGVQFADVTAGLLAASGVVSTLLRRTRTGRGGHVEQPLASGPLPFVAWAMVDTAQSGPEHVGVSRTMLAGKVPCYRCYQCSDDQWISVGCLEPKFWITVCQRLGVPELATAGLDVGARGQAASERVANLFAQRPLDAWLDLLAEDHLPVGPVQTVASALEDGDRGIIGAQLEATPMPDGSTMRTPGPVIPSVSRTPSRPAPKLGQHAETLRREFELDD